MPPNNCEVCDLNCDFCTDLTKACNIKLSYQLKIPEVQIGGTNSATSTAIELHLFREAGKNFSFDEVISQSLSSSALKLKVKSSQESLPFTIETNLLKKITLKVSKPNQITAGQAYTIQGFEPALLTTYKNLVTKVDTNFLLMSEQEAEILNDDIAPEKVEAAAAVGSAVSSVSGSLGVTTDILGVLGVVMSADQTGATLKFS